MEFFPVKVGRLSHKLNREAVAGSVQGQSWSALVLGRFLLEAEGWNRMGFKVSSNPNQEICSALITVNYFFPSFGKGFADEAFVSYKAFAAPVVAVLLHCWLCVPLDVQAACRDTTVTLELLKEGFHRDLLVKVELGEDAGGCAVAAQMRLPPGIYVDPYELATLQQHNLTKVMPSARSSGSESACLASPGAADILTHRQCYFLMSLTWRLPSTWPRPLCCCCSWRWTRAAPAASAPPCPCTRGTTGPPAGHARPRWLCRAQRCCSAAATDKKGQDTTQVRFFFGYLLYQEGKS
ncbi:phosphatidylinositol-glycan biosynthesis class X protein isoform X4 [Taeniopygia guttata]|uniref:phosphatidylinositol-glycan biosynthesis class X protein isoform X4 n=1 Tax=Taeniopygia guttata TaxID=59729 RepID=UPI003BB8DCEE